MQLIVDGYNLLFSDKRICGNISETKPSHSGYTKHQTNKLEEAREFLISRIASYNRSRKDEITIVFDGITNSSRRNKTLSQSDYTKIIFSGNEENADDLIIRLVKLQPNPRQVTVITSDNYIKQNIKPIGATIIDSVNFVDKLGIASYEAKDPKTLSQSNKKLFGITPGEAEQWLKLFRIENEE